MRYAVMPDYRNLNPSVHVRFVVSDPSSYLYFDGRRPLATANVEPYEEKRPLTNDSQVSDKQQPIESTKDKTKSESFFNFSLPQGDSTTASSMRAFKFALTNSVYIFRFRN